LVEIGLSLKRLGRWTQRLGKLFCSGNVRTMLIFEKEVEDLQGAREHLPEWLAGSLLGPAGPVLDAMAKAAPGMEAGNYADTN
jgi:hypothetical protein